MKINLAAGPAADPALPGRSAVVGRVGGGAADVQIVGGCDPSQLRRRLARAAATSEGAELPTKEAECQRRRRKVRVRASAAADEAAPPPPRMHERQRDDEGCRPRPRDRRPRPRVIAAGEGFREGIRSLRLSEQQRRFQTRKSSWVLQPTHLAHVAQV